MSLFVSVRETLMVKLKCSKLHSSADVTLKFLLL